MVARLDKRVGSSAEANDALVARIAFEDVAELLYYPVQLELLQQNLPMFVRLPHLPQRILAFLVQIHRHQPQDQSGILSAVVAVQRQLPSVLLFLAGAHFFLEEKLALNPGSGLSRCVLLNVYDSNVDFEETRLIALVLELEKERVSLDVLWMGENVRC